MSGSSGNYQAPNLVIPYAMPSGTPPELQPVLKPIYIAFQNIVQTLITYCGIAPRTSDKYLSSNGDPTAILANNTHRFYIFASEAIAVGAAVSLANIAGNLVVRNANATDHTKICDGFCSEPAGIPIGGIGEIILNDGVNSALSGLTIGAEYYLGITNGSYTLTPPVTTGNLVQSLGKALSTTTLRFWTGYQIRL